MIYFALSLCSRRLQRMTSSYYLMSFILKKLLKSSRQTSFGSIAHQHLRTKILIYEAIRPILKKVELIKALTSHNTINFLSPLALKWFVEEGEGGQKQRNKKLRGRGDLINFIRQHSAFKTIKILKT